VALAKGDIPLRTWFSMGRSQTLATGKPVLVSWTDTMFEYLMPALWMRTCSDTMLDASLRAAVQAQRAHVSSLDIPWGISEAAYSDRDMDGHYKYHAFGIPALALSPTANDGPVISSYSSFLALPFEREAALANLNQIANMGWIGEYGFYEGGDYRESTSLPERKPEPIVGRSWMAHHQGTPYWRWPMCFSKVLYTAGFTQIPGFRPTNCYCMKSRCAHLLSLQFRTPESLGVSRPHPEHAFVS
jgi:hypothetical protein